MRRFLVVSILLLIVAAGHRILAQQQPGRPPSTASGAIAGTVVDTGTGAPIDGAVVHISASTGTLQSPLQMTDSKGRFLFVNLPAGSYQLRASKSGYTDGAYGADPQNGLELTPVVIGSGKELINARIALGRPSAISGIVTDEAGQPIVNAYVRALRVVMVSGMQQVAAGRVTTTDDRGYYRLGGLTAGRYIVALPSVSASAPASRAGELLAASRDSQARSSAMVKLPKPDGAFTGSNDYVVIAGAYPLPPGREPRAYPPLFHPGGRAIADALPIVLALGEERSGTNFTWLPVPAATVSGRLAGPADVVGNVLVRLAPIGSESLPPGSEAATTLTKADGSFMFIRVPYGEYTFIASRSYAYLSDGDARVLPRPPGFKEGTGGGASIPGSEVGYSYLSDQKIDTHTAREHVSVGARGVNGLSVQLHPNVQLRGRVVIESGAFQLMGASGGAAPPPASGPVRAEPANGDLTLGTPGGMFDSQNGTFYVDGLRAGEYVLRFMGLPTIKSIKIGGADYTTKPIDTTLARGLDEIIVTVTDKVATLSGTVLGKTGEREPSIVVYFPTDRTQWSRYGLRPTRIGAVPVSSSATFKIEIPGGEYFVVALPAAQNRIWQDPKRLEGLVGLATRVTLAWDEKRTETLTVKEAR